MKIKKLKSIFIIIMSIMMFGCGNSGSSFQSNSDTTVEATSESTNVATTITTTVKTTAASTTTLPEEVTEDSVIEPTVEATAEPTKEATEEASADAELLIPEAEQTPKVEGDRLSFTISNVYSEDEYYSVVISGVKVGSAGADTTYIKNDLYGDFRLELYKGEMLCSSVKINVPRDDRFLILESVTDGLSYGCELISNMREYNAPQYPDLIQLDFYIINEGETPQYARFFSVFGGELMELPIYDSGVKVAPYGTHLDMISAGVMDQHIVASTASGAYTVLRYEYTFNVSNRCLIREKTRF